MERKTMVSSILAAVCALTLLAGCSNETPTGANSGESQSEPTSEVSQTETTSEGNQTADRTYTLQEIHKNYQLKELLKQNDYLGYSEELYMENAENAASKTVVQYQNTKTGIQMDSKLTMGKKNTIFKQGRVSEDYPGAVYVISEDGRKIMTAYPEGGYEAELETDWIPGTDVEKETLLNSVNQDGVIIVSTRADYRETDGYYIEMMYYINLENDQLVYWEISTYNAEGKVSQTRKVTPVYNKPFIMEKEPYKEIISDKNYCEVNVVYEYMTDNPNAQWFPVSAGTEVSVSDQKTDGTLYKLYSDADMTKDYVTDTAVAGKTLNVFAVK